MRNELLQRFLVLVLSMAITTGFATHFVRAGDTNATAIAAATVNTDMPMPVGHDGSAGDQKAMAQGACIASCTSMVALPTAVAGIDAVLLGTVVPTIGPVASGHAIPPAPHPPKSSYLS